MRVLIADDHPLSRHGLRKILDKLHVQNRAQVVAYAVRHRLVDTPERHQP